MADLARLISQLRAIPDLTVKDDEPLAPYTRFAIGGPAACFCETPSQDGFRMALHIAKQSAVPAMVIGGGSNLVVADEGFRGLVLRFTGARISRDGDLLSAEAGAVLQDVVDASMEEGLAGLESMTGIPGFLGGAVYGNAGAYGRAMNEGIVRVTFTDGEATHTFDNAACEFRYRESIFKERKDWIVLTASLRLARGDKAVLKTKASEIRSIRDAKYPPDMKCAGSIFKNVFFNHLREEVQQQVPPNLVRDGKIPSAWFLEQAGVKGLRRGDIQVAEYHANLIYNDGNGRASDLIAVVEDCKARVRRRFGFSLEEEVQYVGFERVAV